MLKELGKRYKNESSTSSGIEVVSDFLKNAGIKTEGLFIEDGSGLSPLNAVNTRELVNLLKAKSGSMSRVRNYAGYFSTVSGRNMVFSIIVNNYTGPSKKIISGIEDILKEITLTR